jgi:hypothetical protein
MSERGERDVGLDRNRLVKFMNMTESQHDAEALLAVRKANELLRLNDLNWTDLVDPRPTPRAGPQPAPESRDRRGPHARNFNDPRSRYGATARGRSAEQARADNFRATVRAIPLPIRVLFLPATVGAEVLAYAVLSKRSWVARSFGLVACLAVVGLVGVPWLMLGVGTFGLIRVMLVG